MIRELVYFEVGVGPETERFKAAYRVVREGMAALGVVMGRTWWPGTGVMRTAIMEREFESLAAYEADDERFHSSREFMASWRELEATVREMRVELWSLAASDAGRPLGE